MSFTQGAPTQNLSIVASNIFVTGTSTSGNAFTVQQLGSGNVASFVTVSGSSALFINPAGNVGFGTSPLEPFHIYTGNNGNPTNTGAGADSNAAVRIQMVTIGLDIGVYGNGTTWIQNRQPGTSLGTTFNMVMQPLGGNVGIGTTSPSYLLDVNGQSRIGNPALITDASTVLRMTTSGGASYFQTGTALTSGSVGDTVFTGIYATPEFMRIKSTGNVGIGTASPAYRLDVYSTSSPGARFYCAGASSYILIDNDNAANQAAIQFNRAGTMQWVEYVPGSSTDLRWYNGSDKMTLNASGLLTVGSVSTGTVTATTGTFSSGLTSTTGTFSSTLSGKSGTFSNGDNSNLIFGPNGTWGSYLYVGSGNPGNTVSGQARLLCTNGNCHLDAGTGQTMYLQYYNNAAGGTGGIQSWEGWTHNGSLTVTGTVGCGTVTCGAITSSGGTIQTSYAQGSNAPNAGQAYFYNPQNSAGQNASVNARIAGSSAGSAYYSLDCAGVAGFSWGITGASQNLVFRAAWDFSSGTIFTMDRSGNFTATGSVAAGSDQRLKENIRPIENALEKVNKIGGYTFDRVDMVCDRQAGVIAQELLEVLPEVVTMTEHGTYAVSYGNIVALLIEAVKELTNRVKELELNSIRQAVTADC